MCEWSTFIHDQSYSFVYGVESWWIRLLSSDRVVDGVVDGLLEVLSPPHSDRAAVSGVHEVWRCYLLFSDRFCGVEDSGRVARSSHRLLGRGDEDVEDVLWLVEWPAAPRAEVFGYPLSYHLLEVHRSCQRGLSDDARSCLLGGSVADVPSSELIGVSDVVFDWLLLLVGIRARPDEDRVELGGRIRVRHLLVGGGSQQVRHGFAFRPEVVVRSPTFLTLRDAIKIGDVVGREYKVLPTDPGWQPISNVVRVSLERIDAQGSSWCSLQVCDLVVEAIVYFGDALSQYLIIILEPADQDFQAESANAAFRWTQRPPPAAGTDAAVHMAAAAVDGLICCQRGAQGHRHAYECCALLRGTPDVNSPLPVLSFFPRHASPTSLTEGEVRWFHRVVVSEVSFLLGHLQ